MNVLFVAACEFASNSAVHILSVAKVMQSRGFESAVTFRSDDNNVRPRGDWPILICDHAETMHNGVLFADGRGPDVIHVWTPREHVRKVAEKVVERYGCPYIVHLEDNEGVILADSLGGADCHLLEKLPPRISDQVVPLTLSHPLRARWFLEGAAGVTALIDKLLETKPDSVPGTVFWPGFESGILTAKGLRADFGIDSEDQIVVYNGNIHPSNELEVTSLIDAIGLLNERGIRVKIVKTGANHAALDKLKEAQSKGYLKDLGFVTRSEIHTLLNLADVLVQPGRECAFNDYRFPCKLPEFLATGKPVVMPKANLGRFMDDGVNCLLMEMGDAIEIADKVHLLLQDQELRQKIGIAGKEFALTRLNWDRNLAPVADLYRQCVDRGNRWTIPPIPHVPLPIELLQVPELPVVGSYLERAVRGTASGSLHLEQGAAGNPWIYEKWLAAAVQKAIHSGAPSLEIAGWREEAPWVEATRRGYAAALGNHLRHAGFSVSNVAIEGAMVEHQPQQKLPPKTIDWITNSALQRVVSLYSGSYRLPSVSWGTVRDFCDSVDEMRCLSTLHGDLKNVQRPWAVKAILGMVPLGSRLLEIGAGEPWVADILSRAGYEVWVVDPYDGSGNGPVQLAQFRSECPNVKFIQDTFDDRLLDLPPASFDCVYSISVLEHIDDDGLRALARGARKFLKPDGLSIHAIDHIQRGHGQEIDLKRLELLADEFGIPENELRKSLTHLDQDLDVYTLSAEGLNQWRGNRSYDDFPMRKWVSIQLVTNARSATHNLEAAGHP